MADASRARVARSLDAESFDALAERARRAPPPPALRLGAFDVIAELKRRSPAAGTLAEAAFDREAQLAAYARGGAAAVSVLTEPDEFHGSLADLEAAAAALGACALPVMRKDFVTSPYQVLEARAAGAGGVLVIVTMLDDAEVADLVRCAQDFGMFVLLEGFDAGDLERIAGLGLEPDRAPILAGVNCRDLKTLAVDFGRFETLAAALPAGLPAVAESGLEAPADAGRVAALGYRLALVGSALMRAGDPAGELAGFIAAGRGEGAPRADASA
jgi:indole-3-glycerol phosphate synthase